MQPRARRRASAPAPRRMPSRKPRPARPGDEPGTYRQTACILGGNDMAKSISRSITITAD